MKHARPVARRRVRAGTFVALAVVGLVAIAGLAAACGGSTPSATPAGPSTDPSTPSPSSAPSSAVPAAEVRVFFVPGGSDPCGTVAPVVRKVVGPPTAGLALRELLAGPTPDEAAAGFTSLFGPQTADTLLDVVVIDGIARVSFRDLRPIIPNASSSCGSAALLGALEATLAQLPGIRGARYSFAGDEVAFYEWLQMAPPD
jgi:spore germination protein GerM